MQRHMANRKSLSLPGRTTLLRRKRRSRRPCCESGSTRREMKLMPRLTNQRAIRKRKSPRRARKRRRRRKISHQRKTKRSVRKGRRTMQLLRISAEIPMMMKGLRGGCHPNGIPGLAELSQTASSTYCRSEKSCLLGKLANKSLISSMSTK